MIPQNLEELKDLKQWVNYIRIWNPTKNGGRGGYDKPPINPATLRDGMTNNPKTWTTYDPAAANTGKTATHKDTKHKDAQGNAPIVEAPVEGTGLVLAFGYCGVDLDGVLDEDGNLAHFAAAILERLDTYAEISPSGRGLHALLYCGDLLSAATEKERKIYKDLTDAGTERDAAIKRAMGAGDFGKQFTLDQAGAITSDAGKAYELEVYFYKWGGRYFTVTGNPFPGFDKPINREKGAELRAIYDEYTAKTDAYKAAQRPAPSVGSLTTPGRPATGSADKQMIESALRSIDPAALDFAEWAAIMTALKVLGYSLSDAEAFSSGGLCGSTNPKNDPKTNAYRWAKFTFKKGDESAAGIIINAAKRFSWTPAQAYDDDARAEYGRSLHSEEDRLKWARAKYSEEQRRDYGRKLHAHDFDFTEEDRAGFEAWKARHKANPQTGTPAAAPARPATPRATGSNAPRPENRRTPEELSLDDFQDWKERRKK